METERAATLPLDYHVPPARRAAPAAEAMLLCAPGLLCWGWFLILRFCPAPVPSGMLHAFWVLWFLAVATAIVSVFRYALVVRVFTPAVILNLTVNTAGLLFSIAGLFNII